MLKYFLAYQFGHAFPKLVWGLALVVFGLVVLFSTESAITYHLHPYHYEQHGNVVVKVPGRMEWPVDRALSGRER